MNDEYLKGFDPVEDREIVSNCCSTEIYYSDICSQCGEHCEAALLE